MVAGFIRVRLGAFRVRRVYSGLRGFSRASLDFAGILWVLMGSLGYVHGSPG